MPPEPTLARSSNCRNCIGIMIEWPHFLQDSVASGGMATVYRAWDTISRDRDRFVAWVKRHILDTQDFAEYLRLQSEATKEQAILP